MSPVAAQHPDVEVRPRSEAEADPARTLPATDAGGAFIKAGLGIFVETLAVAAAAAGHGL